MSYVIIEVNPDIQGHWGFFDVEIRKHHHHWAHHLDNAHIEKVWANFVAPGHVLYQFHIKSGHFPHHHHFSVLAEAHNGHFRIINIVEGHNTLF